MARTRASDYDEKRGAILEAAARIFAEKGYDRTPMSVLARECGVNANQVCRWLRERGHVRRPRPPASRAVAMPSPFVAVPVIAATAPVENTAPAVMQLQARLPNGVAIELGGIDVRHVGQVIEALGRLRCSGSTKG